MLSAEQLLLQEQHLQQLPEYLEVEEGCVAVPGLPTGLPTDRDTSRLRTSQPGSRTS